MRRLATLVLAAVAIPALAAAQENPRNPARGQRGERMEQQDTTGRARPTSHRARSHRMRSSGGEVAMQSGLDRSQVEQLQQALRDDGCDPGPADGIIGPRTRRAMACSRQKHSLTGRNTNELLRALNLPFTAPDSMGTGGMMRHRGEMRDTTGGMMRDTTGGMMSDTTAGGMRGMRGGMPGMHRGMRDSTRRMRNRTRRPGDTARPDTTHQH